MESQPPSSTLPAPGHPVGECCRHRNCELGNPDWLLKRPVCPPAPSCTLALCNAANYGSLSVTLTCYSTVHCEYARYGNICEFTALLLHHWHCQCQSIRRYHISGMNLVLFHNNTFLIHKSLVWITETKKRSNSICVSLRHETYKKQRRHLKSGLYTWAKWAWTRMTLSTGYSTNNRWWYFKESLLLLSGHEIWVGTGASDNMPEFT